MVKTMVWKYYSGHRGVADMKQANSVQELQAWLRQQLVHSADVIYNEIKNAEMSLQLLYIQSVCDEAKIMTHIIAPFYSQQIITVYDTYLESLPDSSMLTSPAEGLEQILHGSVIIFLEKQIYIFEAPKFEASPIAPATVEKIVQGPKDSLSEDIQINLNLIRNRYRSKTLAVEMLQIGELSKAKVAVIYDQLCVDNTILNQLKAKLNELKVELISSADQLSLLLSQRKFELFPTTMSTERPDRMVKNLSEGKICILIEGIPTCLLLPSVFYDFISAMDDNMIPPIVGNFFVALRYLGLFVSVTLPAFYVGITTYNPEFFRIQLILLIAGSREIVPYPAYTEMLLMLIIMEFLIEASIRLPKTIGQTATTVGGLILGQAATGAGLVSNIVIIIVAAVAISNFVIPINTMSYSFRVVKYILLALASFLGILGIIVGLIGLVLYLTNLRSFGKPYLKIFK
jgi:spore germination protein